MRGIREKKCNGSSVFVSTYAACLGRLARLATKLRPGDVANELKRADAQRPELAGAHPGEEKEDLAEGEVSTRGPEHRVHRGDLPQFFQIKIYEGERVKL